MYAFDQVLTGVRQPRLAAMEINRRFSSHVLEHFRPKHNVFLRDWDNLVILDACRYDVLAETGFAEQLLDWTWSDGSNSEEFIQYSVQNGALDDVVWVTANPWVSKFNESIYKVIDLWNEAWDNSLNTVPADSVAERSLDAVSTYPDKRIVVHFMQPHYPFVGDHDETLPEHASFTGDGIRSATTEAPTIWEHLQRGNVERDTVWEAYKANLEYVLPSVETLVKELPGKTVVTADHGNSFGSRGFPVPLQIFGHPRGLRYEPLVKVPWVEFPAEERRAIESAEIVTSKVDETTREKRLKSLGYLGK